MGNAGIISSTVSPKVETSNQNGEGELTGGSFFDLTGPDQGTRREVLGARVWGSGTLA